MNRDREKIERNFVWIESKSKRKGTEQNSLRIKSKWSTNGKKRMWHSPNEFTNYLHNHYPKQTEEIVFGNVFCTASFKMETTIRTENKNQ